MYVIEPSWNENIGTFMLESSNAWLMHSQFCFTLWDALDCSPPGSFIYGIFQATILDWIAISSSSESSQLEDRTCISYVSPMSPILQVESLLLSYWVSAIHSSGKDKSTPEVRGGSRGEWQTTSVFLLSEPHEQYEKAKW